LHGAAVHGVGRYQTVAEALGQSPSHVAEAAEEAFAVPAQQAAVFEQLQDQMSDLQQYIEVLDLLIPGAVSMLQIEPAVLLDVESFVFDFPAASAAAVGQSGDVVGADGEVGQPCEELLPVAVLFLALECVKLVGAVLVIGVLQIADPREGLLDAFGGAVGPAVFGAQVP